MKKLLLLLLTIIPLISTPVYAGEQVSIPVEVKSPTEISLLHEGEVKDKKYIEDEYNFIVEVNGIGKYEYELTDGTTIIDIDIYKTADGQTTIIYTGEVKLEKAVFGDDPVIPTDPTEEPTEESTENPTEEPTTEPIEEPTEPSTTPVETTTPTDDPYIVPPTETYVTDNPTTPTGQTTPTNTGEKSYLPILIPVCAGAGAGIGVAVYFLARKKR